MIWRLEDNQIDPGIITVNDTDGYLWEDFEKRIIHSVNTLFEAYPESKNNLKFNSVILRYIDAIALDFKKENIFNFLISTKPKGAVHLRFVRRKMKESDALIWETMVQSTSEYLPKIQDEIIDWIKEAHDLMDDWFFKF